MSAVIVGVVVGVAIRLVFSFQLASNHHVAVATVQETTEGLGRVDVFLVWTTSVVQGLLHEIKQLLCHYWLVFAYVHFFKVAEVPVVERIFQNGCHSVDVDSLASSCHHTLLGEERGDILQPTIALAVQLKSLTDNHTPLLIDHDSLGSGVIEVADWCTVGIFATPHFLPESTLGILRQRIHIVFALSKGDIEHELSLWRWFKPECGELQRHNTTCIEEIDNPPAVHTISSQPIRIPTN